MNIRILDNTANSTGGAGISMEGGAFDANGLPVGGALIEGNTANENAETGISVADGGHTVRDNNAHNNSGYGISIGENPEVPGEPFTHTNIDGGGNRASGNVEVAQCSGLVCDTSGSEPLLPVDTGAPQTTIDAHPTPVASSGSATFEFSSQDNINPQTGEPFTPETAMIYECRLDPPPDPLPEPEEPETEPPHPNELPDIDTPPDPGNWIECSSPVRYQALEDGMHHFEVRARDQADLVDETPATYDWEIDVTIPDEALGPDSIEPDSRISAAPPQLAGVDSATFRFAGSDNLTPGLRLTFECRLDGGAWGGCEAPKTYAGLANGSHTFEVRAIDLAGNVESTPASHTWEVDVAPTDSVAPDTTLDPRSRPDHGPHQRDVHVLQRGRDGDVPVLAGRGRLGRLRLAEGLSGPRGRHAHLRRPRGRSGRQPRRDPSHSGLDRRHGAGGDQRLLRPEADARARSSRTISPSACGTASWSGPTASRSTSTATRLTARELPRASATTASTTSPSRTAGSPTSITASLLNAGTTSNIVDSVTVQNNQEGGMVLGLPPWQSDPTQPAPAPPPPTYKSGVADNTIRSSSVFANAKGIWLTNDTRSTVARGNLLAGNSNEGVWIDRSHGNLVDGNDIQGSSKDAVAIQGSDGNTVSDNSLTENGGGVLVGVTDSGTAVGIPSHDNRIEGNTLDETGGPALELVGTQAAPVTGNELIDNVAHRSNGSGIELYHARETLMRGNDVTREQDRDLARQFEREPARVQRRERVRGDRHRGRGPLAEQRAAAEHVQPQRRDRASTSATRSAAARAP